MALAKEAGAKRAATFNEPAPSHCSMEKPVAAWRERLAGIDVMKNRAGNRFVEAFDDLRGKFARRWSSSSTIRCGWIETVEFLARNGVTRIVECGPARSLRDSASASRRVSSA